MPGSAVERPLELLSAEFVCRWRNENDHTDNFSAGIFVVNHFVVGWLSTPDDP